MNRAYLKQINKGWSYLILTTLSLWTNLVFARGGGGGTTLGSMAASITSSFEDVGKLITAGSYVGGLACVLAAIFKFRQWKENPAQMQIGTPITFLLIGAGLLFLPSVLDVASYTLFGDSGATTAGPTGTTYS